MTTEGQLLWDPDSRLVKRSRMTRYLQWLESHLGVRAASYHDAWRWSVADIGAFWESIWLFFDVRASRPYTAALKNPALPGADWFPGAELSFVDHVFRNARADRTAILFRSERIDCAEISWSELEATVAAVATRLLDMSVKPGDRVASYMPNIPETLVAFLATASVGGIWSSCPPDFGAASVIDRFRQIEPKVLFAVDGYTYGGRNFDRRSVLLEIQRALPGLEHTILYRYLDKGAGLAGLESVVSWEDAISQRAGLQSAALAFSHPLWVVYTSGTTGLPKPVVHSQGGILLETLKSLALHLDVGEDDVFFWYTSSGWVMWNIVVGALLTGATIVLYDGSVGHKDLNVVWEMARDFKISVLGTSPAFVAATMKAAKDPGRTYDLRCLKTVGSTGSPLTVEQFEWIYAHVGENVWLASLSGGTDVATAFVGACPLLPVTAGELQCRYLGVDAQAFDEHGRALEGEVGELVITKPMPSMPLFFWNDPDGSRYRESYFQMYPGVWRHGDWIRFTARGTAIIYGRSDSTINRQGIRMGTSDIYRVVEAIPEVIDSLAVDLEVPGGAPNLLLFVVTRAGAELDDRLKDRIKTAIRVQLSPRHVPDEITAIAEVPRTLNGKKLEVPVKRILLGHDTALVLSPGAMANPDSLGPFLAMAAGPRTRGADRPYGPSEKSPA